jgi:hypothetical protein
MPQAIPRAAALLGIALAALLAACAGIPVQTDYDEGTEFLFYTSFAVPAGVVGRVETLADARIRKAVVDGLTAKGLAEAPAGKADLLVRWHTRFRRRVILSDPFPGPFWAPRRMDVYHVREGVLTIELIDRAQGRVVWQGTATGVVQDPERNRENIRRAVAAILAKYPPMH